MEIPKDFQFKVWYEAGEGDECWFAEVLTPHPFVGVNAFGDSPTLALQELMVPVVDILEYEKMREDMLKLDPKLYAHILLEGDKR